ncbi:Uncharacterised protein [Amycolatopsis camponoti]|uniref:Uncharacterized protein n=1 Tax=Amycolatopsis camponoti TaxID=2606593 RepID=A0A6I8LTP1_9PSEU|nr:Uncharacterised protein [Amycolatopsis camponoti]
MIQRPDFSGSPGGFFVVARARVALNTASKIGVGSPSSRFGRSSPGLRFSSPTRPVSATAADFARAARKIARPGDHPHGARFPVVFARRRIGGWRTLRIYPYLISGGHRE